MQTPESTLEALANRIEELERQYQRLKAEVATEKLILVDATGRTRAALRMSDEVPGGVPELALVLHDTNGNVCLILTVNAKGPSLYLLGSKKTASLELKVTDFGADISLFDENFRQRLALKVIPWESGGVPSLSVRNANGTDTVTQASLDNGPSINLSDPANADGNTIVRLQVDDEGPRLQCLKDGKFLWSAP
jgi:hypothetical protein